MKRLVFLLILFFSSKCFSAWNDQNLQNESSFTATNDTTKAIVTVKPGDIFRGVIISSESASRVLIYDSSASANNQIGRIGTGAAGGSSIYIPFDIRLSSGLTYTTTGNSMGITFIYFRTRAR